MDNDADFERHINSAMDALESAIDEDYEGDFKERYDHRFEGSWSDNNLNEKQQYSEAEKEEPVYIEECKPYQPFDVASEPPPNLELQACPICTRKFAPASLSKHIGICERVQTKKRKPFDSSRQRREGTELASYLPKNFGLPQKTAIPVRKLSLSKTPTFERKQYNPTAMSTSMPSASSTPKPALKRSMSQQNEPCPYCERCFGMKAYDRHVEWCREKALLSKNASNNQTVSAAKERLQARIQYKAPQLRSKRALNREKYSGSLSCGGSTNSLAELDLHMPRHNSMCSSVSSDNGYSPDRYDPFLSARRQLEELFSPTTSLIHTSSPGNSTSTSRLNQIGGSGGGPHDTGHKSTGDGSVKTSPLNSNFRRAYSLRMPRKVSRAMYVEKAKSNIQKGITDDGPVSPNFLKSSEYDELPIKSTFNALQMATEPKPKLRDSSTVRRNLKLDLKDPNNPAGADLPLSKTDSLAVFLKYETELALSEKDMKDKSNSLSKRTSSLSAEAGQQRKQEPSTNVVNLPVAKKPPETPAHEPEPKPDRSLPPGGGSNVDEASLARKQSQKLVPIKLEPINITYNGGGGSAKESPQTHKPIVISLDAIIGKSSCAKPKDSQFEVGKRSDSNYIDPKLINKCDNLPINLVKTQTLDMGGSGNSRTGSSSASSSTIGNNGSLEQAKQQRPVMRAPAPEVVRSVPPPPPPRTSIKVFQKPPERARSECGSETSNGTEGGTTSSTSNNSSPTGSHSTSPVDNRSSGGDSTNSDKRPQLTRQDREDSGYRTGQESGPDGAGFRGAQEQTNKPSTLPIPIVPVDRVHKSSPHIITSSNNVNRPLSSSSATANASQQLPTPVRPAAVSGAGTPLNSTGGRGRSPIVSALEDFDVDEFMQSLEDLHRRSPAGAQDFKQSLFGRTQSTVSSRSVTTGGQIATTAGSGKRSNSLDSSNSNTIVSTNHFERTGEGSSGVPRVDVRVRNGSGTASNHNSSNSSSSISSPSHYSKSFYSSSHYNNSINNNSPHNHSVGSSSNGSGKGGHDSSKRPYPSESTHPLAQRMNFSRNSPIVARRRASEESSTFSLPSVPPSPGDTGSSSTSTVQNLPSIHQSQPTDSLNRNGNGISAGSHQTARSFYSSPVPVNGRPGGYNANPYHPNLTGAPSSTTTTPTTPQWPGSFHDSRFPEESFDHLERDLLKSVQELDRMCGSSSSVCSIDSEELYSVEDYPLHKRSSERSQASADSAYRSSLSTQSPPDYTPPPPVPLRQGRPGSRSSNASQHQQAPTADSAESTFNALPTHNTSLPPLTSASLKGLQAAMHPHKDMDKGMDSSGLTLIMNPMSKFCHDCGARFMVSSAKFCMSCGVRRIMME